MEIVTMLKVLTIALAGVLTFITMKRVMTEMRARVRVRPNDHARARAVTRLRQDPRTGVYYPED